MPDDADRLAQRIADQQVVLGSHLPPFDPLLQADEADEVVDMFVAVDVDLGMFQTTDGSERMLVAEGIRQHAGFSLYVPAWRRLYALADDGESVAIGDGDPEGEMAWAAVYRHGQLVAGHAEPQPPSDPT